MVRIFLDSCVVIYLREGTPEQRARLHERMEQARSSGAVFAVSELVRFECRVGAIKRADAALLADYDAFFSLPEVQFAQLDRAAFDKAAELRAGLALKTPDALQVAAALGFGCDEFWTNDRRLASTDALLRVTEVY